MTTLVIDSNYLCHRAFHTFRLSHNDIPTGIPYGFFMEVDQLTEYYLTERVVFCFDWGYGHRKKLRPSYKATRSIGPPEKLAERKAIAEQTHCMMYYLRDMGYANILAADGFEADDMIGAVVNSPADNDYIIVSADKDLWQLLRPGVCCYNPSTKSKNPLVTHQSFQEDWGLVPSDWAHVKAIAGCDSDDVEGLEGVGEKTAAKYLTGSMDPKTKTFKAIENFRVQWRENLKLVRLPFPGTPPFHYRPDGVTPETRGRVFDSLGFKTLDKKW